jgi:hypothetical protein
MVTFVTVKVAGSAKMIEVTSIGYSITTESWTAKQHTGESVKAGKAWGATVELE